MSNQLEKVKELIELRAQARLGGGEKAIEKQHAKGKYTARERIAMLLDEGCITSQGIDTLLNTCTTRVVQSDAGSSHLHGHIHHLTDLE